MRIIRCNIAGFGKFSDTSFDFTDGCNIICRENGFGKSTLAAFVKVMFFGFTNDKGRDMLANERKRYLPWQGGVYGGSIEFAAGGRRFLIERTFGKTKAGDKFVLRDAETNLNDDAYSENIGEELFKIDAESFTRTVFISQSECETSATDSINAKLGNLAENTDDINNYETASKRIEDMLNKMSPSRKTGELYKLKEQLAVWEENIKSEAAADRELALLDEEKAALLKSEGEYKNSLAALKKDEGEARRYKDAELKAQRYENILSAADEARKELEEKARYFKNGIPDENGLNVIKSKNEEFLKKLTEADIYRPSEEEEKNLLECGENPEEALLKTDECMKMLDVRREKAAALNSKKSAYEMLNQSSAEVKRPPIWLLAAGIVLIAAAIALAAASLVPYAAGLAVLGAALIIIRYALRAGNKPAEDNEKKLDSLRNEIDCEERDIKAADTELSRLFAELKLVYSAGSGDNAAKLSELKDSLRLCVSLKKKKLRFENAERECEKYADEITAYLKKYGFEPQESFDNQLDEIRQHLRDYTECTNRCGRAAAELNRFEAENASGLKELKAREKKEFKPLAEFDAEREEIEEKIADINGRISQISRREAELSDEKDRISDIKEMYAEGREKYEEGLLKHKRLEYTRSLLQTAKQSFTARYTEPIMNEFRRFYKMLCGNAPEKIHMDADINITIDETGTQHEVRFFSSGTRSLVYLCMRMALVEAMYDGEKPPLIFDDPFVCLDSERAESARKMLDVISKEYQVLYFTCRGDCE